MCIYIYIYIYIHTHIHTHHPCLLGPRGQPLGHQGSTGRADHDGLESPPSLSLSLSLALSVCLLHVN